MKKNRLFALMLALAVMLTCMPAMAFAADDNGGSDKARTEVSDEGDFAEAEPSAPGMQSADPFAVPEPGENPDSSDHPFKNRAEQVKAAQKADTDTGEITKEHASVNAQASPDWEIQYSSLTLEYSDDYEPYYVWIYGESLYYTPTVKSSNTNVVSVGEIEYMYYDEYDDGYNYRVPLYREGGGKATITVKDYYGNTKTCSVTAGYTPYRMNIKSYSFDKKHPYDSVWLYNYYWGKDRELVKAKSSNKKVATTKISYGEVKVTPKKAGKATITVTDRTGKKTSIRITVAKNWKKANLKYNSSAYIYYSGTKAYVYSKPNTRFTLKIGGKTFKKKTNKKGYCHVNIKKHYKLNKKFTVSFNNKGVRCTIKGKVKSDTYAYKYFVCGRNNYAEIKVYNATKGDRVYIKVGGKWFSTKLGWSGDGIVTIWPSESLYYYGISKLVVKNKYKQVLYSYTY